MATGSIPGGEVSKNRWSESKVYTRKAFKGPKKNDNSIVSQSPSKTLEDPNSAPKQLLSRFDAVSDNSSNRGQQPAVPSLQEVPPGNGIMKLGITRVDNRVRINIASRSKQEMGELRRKLESELGAVKDLVKKIEAKVVEFPGYANSQVSANDGGGGVAKRVHSEVDSAGGVHESRPLNQLSISAFENSQGVSDSVEKEKRTPKANQFYRNSEFLLAKDKFPPAESNKKSKSNGKKHGGGGDVGPGFGIGKYSHQVFKSCSNLLEKLMKHKHGWVFNIPVDVKGMGLHDYFTIIKYPMDLGTVKSRLNKNWYKSPREFAEDVRLTFRNAMTYNPKGQDVYVMAELLSKIFEDKWAVIEAEYRRELMLQIDYESSLPTPTSRRGPPAPPPLNVRRILDRSESMTQPVASKLKPAYHTPRTPVPKKPKAKDLHKRDMTYEEKQKLSTNLQNLPSEKLDNIVQIIKKGNSALNQHDDEIEVDIDNVDTETLWELDRFVTNYKKNVSKNKRKAELSVQVRAEPEKTVLQENNPALVVEEAPQQQKTDEKNMSSSSPNQGGKQGDIASRSSSSCSSSSDSGSSSTDSDSDSSSAGSDTGQSPRI
ncbi:NET domain [Dillenia turbinata]|uniref:NET domain n=1 Tax=Dillenia turbinata TaxID=194707 RepID=A0AAN8YXV0_9MAGN